MRIFIEFFPPLQITQTCSDNPCKNNATCQPGTGGQVCQSKACVTLKDWEVFQMHSSKNSGMSVPCYWHCVDMFIHILHDCEGDMKIYMIFLGE